MKPSTLTTPDSGAAPPRTEAAEHRDGTAPPPGVGARVGKHSAIYAICGLAGKAVGFLLLPLYTRLLTADQVGAIGVVIGIVGFLNVLYPMALGAAVTRFYHQYRDRPDELKAFLGTVLTATFALSIGASALLLWSGPVLLQPLLADIAFWPLMAMGIGVAAFQPFIEIYLIVLQTAERPARYGVIALANLLAKTLIAIALVAGVGLGAEGVLGANLCAAIVFATICLLGARRFVHLGLRRRYLVEALTYSVPILPHTLGSHTRGILDRMFLLHLVSQAATGLYSIGFQIGSLTQIVCMSTTKTITPIFMRAMQEEDEARLNNIRNLALTLVFVFCWVSAAISLFAPEVLVVLAGSEFHEAYRVVPFLAFMFAATGVYSLFVIVLFFHKRMAKYVGVGTVVTLGISAGLNVLLIPLFGMEGAAAAALATQAAFTITVGVMAHRHSPIDWHYGRYVGLFALAFAVSLWPLTPHHEVSWWGAAAKSGVVGVLFCAMSIIAWGSPLFLLREWRELRREWRGD